MSDTLKGMGEEQQQKIPKNQTNKYRLHTYTHY